MTNTNKTGSQITNHCRECGDAVEEFCAEHPKSIVDSIVSNAQTYVIRRADFGYFLSTEASADAYCIDHKLIAATVVES